MSTNSAVAPIAGAGNGHSGLQALTPEAQWSYADLKRVLTKQGLLKRQHRYYARELFVTFALSGLAIGLMVTLGQSWWQLGTAVLFAFVSLRWAYVGHDGGHRQIFARPLHNDALVIGSTSLWTGFSLSWWMDQHNRHHAFPNHDGRDPNATLGPFAFSPEQYQRKRGINRRIARLQAGLWLPLGREKRGRTELSPGT